RADRRHYDSPHDDIRLAYSVRPQPAHRGDAPRRYGRALWATPAAARRYPSRRSGTLWEAEHNQDRAARRILFWHMYAPVSIRRRAGSASSAHASRPRGTTSFRPVAWPLETPATTNLGLAARCRAVASPWIIGHRRTQSPRWVRAG